MEKFELIESFINGQNSTLSTGGLLIDLFLTGVLVWILAWIYTNYGTTLSNRKKFSNNFILIAMTTMLIISVVKSSLALSLGLVGALSIVRFRAAIKEPEELAYLFLAISIGLGFGANQRLITIVAFLVIMFFVFVRYRLENRDENSHLNLIISTKKNRGITTKKILDIVKKHATQVELRRLDENKTQIEIALLVNFNDFKDLEKTQKDLGKLSTTIKVSFIDHQVVL